MTVKVLTEKELAEVSEDLGLDISYITELHQKAVEGANVAGSLKEFKEFALKQAETEGQLGESQEDEDQDQGGEGETMSEETTKENRLAELATQLDPEQRTELLAVLGVSEQSEGVGLQDVLKELQTTNAALAETRLIAEKALQESASGISTDLLLEAIGTPRKKPQFVTRAKSEDGDGGEPDDVDKQIFEKLDTIEQKLKDGTGGGDLYDSFTSRRLGKSGE